MWERQENTLVLVSNLVFLSSMLLWEELHKNWTFFICMFSSELFLLLEKGLVWFSFEKEVRIRWRKMVSLDGQPCKCILKFWGSKEFLLSLVWSVIKFLQPDFVLLVRLQIEFWLLASYNLCIPVTETWLATSRLVSLKLIQSDNRKMQQMFIYHWNPQVLSQMLQGEDLWTRISDSYLPLPSK